MSLLQKRIINVGVRVGRYMSMSMLMSRKIAEKIVDFFFGEKEEAVVEKVIMKKEEPLIGKRLATLRDKMWFICEHGREECICAENYMFFSFDTIYGERLVVVRYHEPILIEDSSNCASRFLMYFKITDNKYKYLYNFAMAFPGYGFSVHTEELFSVYVDNNNEVEINTYNECKYITKKEIDLAILEVENKIDELYDKYKQLYEEEQRKCEAIQAYSDKLAKQFQEEY